MDYEKIAVQFQQRLGEMAARYEADLAIMQVNHNAEVESLKQTIAQLREGQHSHDDPVEAEVVEA